ncbi:MAG: sodium/proline symporter, partial [Clostridiales bacterium]
MRSTIYISICDCLERIDQIKPFIIYFVIVLGIGLYFFKKGGQNADGYFLGGRQMNKWVVAISAQASDMSGWLLMGLPGTVYALGMGQMWVAVGLAIGTYLNWFFTAERLRRFTEIAGNSITIPEYLQNRFKTSSMALRVISAAVFFICFTVYAASAFKAGGTVFSTVFNIPFNTAAIFFSIIVLIYTFLGGFHAVCWTDFVQGMLMLAAVLFAPIGALFFMGSLDAGYFAAIDPNFLNPIPGGAFTYASFATIISGLAWGLGYFGMPHILVRFMSIKTPSEMKTSRR